MFAASELLSYLGIVLIPRLSPCASVAAGFPGTFSGTRNGCLWAWATIVWITILTLCFMSCFLFFLILVLCLVFFPGAFFWSPRFWMGSQQRVRVLSVCKLAIPIFQSTFVGRVHPANRERDNLKDGTLAQLEPKGNSRHVHYVEDQHEIRSF